MEASNNLFVAAFSGLVGMVTMGIAAYMWIYRKAMTKEDHEVICSRTQNSVSAKLDLVHEKVGNIKEQGDKLEAGLREAVPETEVNGHPTQRVYNTLNISFKYIEGEALLNMMEMEGIAVSTGSACSSGSSEPSRILKAMNLDPLCSRGAIRFSLGLGTTEADIEHCLKFIPPLALKFQQMSPFGQ